MTQILIVIAAAIFLLAVGRFFVGLWTAFKPRRRSGVANNWRNEAYMAHEDGMSWSEIDGTFGTTAPRHPGGTR